MEALVPTHVHVSSIIYLHQISFLRHLSSPTSLLFWEEVSYNQGWPQIPYVGCQFPIFLSLSPVCWNCKQGPLHLTLCVFYDWFLPSIIIAFVHESVFSKEIKAVRNQVNKMGKRRSYCEGLAHMLKEPKRFMVYCPEARSLERPVAPFYLVWRPETHEFWG